MAQTENAAVKNCYQGIFVTETILGNPNGDHINNEPRNINGRVFTTDKCIKYNIRNFLHEKYEEINTDEKEVKSVENFVFFYPRLTEGAEKYQASYLTKDTVFKTYFVDVFKKSQQYKEIQEKYKDDKKDTNVKNKETNDLSFKLLLDKCPDCRMFGGTFSFQEDNKQIYGPVQISYGIDLIGADIITLKIGTPFSTKNGQQKTTGEEHIVDHAVIAYDITVNPNHSPGLLKNDDLTRFMESIVYGTNLRKSTSKKTQARLLIMVKFNEGVSVNIGELKHLIDIESKKITDPKKNIESKDMQNNLVLGMSKVKTRLDNYWGYINQVIVYKDENVTINNFESIGREGKDIRPLLKSLVDLEIKPENPSK